LRPNKTKAALASLLGMVALLVAACGSSSSGNSANSTNLYNFSYTYQTPSKTGGTLVLGDWQMPDSASTISDMLDPTVVNNNVHSFMWSNCVTQLPDIKLGLAGWKPDLCKDVPTMANGDESQDGTKTTLRIDPNAKWSDGQPIVADDLLMYYNMFVDPNIAGNGGTPPWDKAKVTKMDNATIQINWGQPYAPYLIAMSGTNVGVGFFPSHLYPTVYNNGTYHTEEAQKLISDPNFLNKPVVDGAYMPQSFGTGGTTVVMVPNPNYHSNFFHKPALDKVIFQAAGSKDALIQAFKAGGTYNQVEDFTFADLPKFSGIPANEIVTSPAYDYEHLELNERVQAPNAKLNGGPSIFADEAVRKAFAEGFNKCRVLTGILGVNCTDPLFATDEFTSPVDPAFDATTHLPTYNSTQAGADLTAAGYPLDKTGVRLFKDGKTPMQLTVVTTKGNLVRNSTLALLQQDWQTNLGITLNLVEDPKIFAPYTAGGFLATGNFDVALFAFTSAADGDSLTFVITKAATPSQTNQGGQNYSGVNDPQIEQQLTTARQDVANPTQRVTIYKQVYQELTQRVYFIPLYGRPQIALVTPDLGNYRQNPTSSGDMWNGPDWSLS